MRRHRNRNLKLWVRIILALVIAFGVCIPLLEIYLFFLNRPTSKEHEYFATINKNSAYKINLYDNTFTDETRMQENKVYISDLVKDIDMNLMYSYSATNNTNLEYSYDVVAQLIGETTNNENGKDIVWDKDYQLIKKKSINTSDASFNIGENLNIDFPKYNSEVKDFKTRFGINTTTTLKIIMNISINGAYNGKLIDKKDKIVLEIPLGVQAFSIKEDYKKQEVYNIYKENDIKKTDNIFIYIVICVVSIILLIILHRVLFNIKKKSEAEKKLDKILKTYDQIIVEVTTPLITDGLNIENVKNFNEMVDLEEELRIPIIMHREDALVIFTITYNQTLYIYKLDDNQNELEVL